MINIMDEFERVASAHADEVAVRRGTQTCAFGELMDYVLYGALLIDKALNGAKGKVVAVCLPRGQEAVVADLAILYSGNAYMNLDSNAPEARLAAILEQTQPALVIAAEIKEVFSKISTLRPSEWSTPRLTEADRAMARSLRESRIDTDLACLINTSGSTGTPKAVALSHRGFIDFMEAVKAAGLMPENAVIGSLSPAIFDIFSFELCLLAINGSRLVLLSENNAAFPVRLLQEMAGAKVSFIFWVPTIMVNIANMNLLENAPLPDLKMVWFAGEVFPTPKFNYWQRCLPDVIFANFYGPIEITLDCLYFIVDRRFEDWEQIPIGRPFKNTSVLVLDENDREIPPTAQECEGELCVRGSSLALGYYRDPDKTARAFIINPLNHAYPEIIYRTGDIVCWNAEGLLMFKGRKDTLIKRHGYRIELSELEHVALARLENITNCCCFYEPQAQKIIMVYESDMPLDRKTLAAGLAAVLPRYMLPNEYRHVTSMPMNVNGKIDRMALMACSL